MFIAAFIVSGGVVPIRVIVGMSVVLVPDAVLVMRERHALTACDCGQALDGDGHGQEQQSKKPE